MSPVTVNVTCQFPACKEPLGPLCICGGNETVFLLFYQSIHCCNRCARDLLTVFCLKNFTSQELTKSLYL